MILASHQPNFMPYMGFFFKMYLCDHFTLSDACQYSKKEFHSFNYFDEGVRARITVPVERAAAPINQIRLSDWNYTKKKLVKRLQNDYCKSPFYKQFFPLFHDILDKEYVYLSTINTALIKQFYSLFNMKCELSLESELGEVATSGDASHQILSICKAKKCDTYLSGIGAKTYLDTNLLECNGIKVLWSKYEDRSQLPNCSAFDYLMKNGPVIPDDWKKERMRIHSEN